MTRIEPSAMDDTRLDAEIEHLQAFFDECAAMEQGISTKESVHMRRLVAERDARRVAGLGGGTVARAA